MDITITDQQRRVLLIIGFVLITLVMIVAVWWVFFTPIGETPLVNTNGNVNGGRLPTTNVPTGSGVITNTAPPDARLPKIEDRATGGLTIATPLVDAIVRDAKRVGEELRYYDPKTGKFYKILADGTIVNCPQKFSWSKGRLGPVCNEAI